MAAIDPKPANGINASEKTNTNGNASTSQYKLPTPETLREVGEINLKDEHGADVPFKSLYEGKADRQLIIFIRHFYCGHCEDYIRTLAKSLPPTTLASTTPPTTLTIIGHGNPVCIADYRTRTMTPTLGESNAWKIYSEPSRALYEKLEMVSNLAMGDQPPEYLQKGVMASVAGSMKNMLTHGTKGFKGGAFSQNGGELLFEGGELRWIHRMRNTGDHAGVEELKKVLELN